MAANLRTRISELSSAIKRQEEILKNLRKSKSDAQCELNALADPMARLPLELSSDIFALCVPDFPHPCRVEAPVTFLRVSRAWRTVALSSAPLWTALLIPSTRSDKLPDSVHSWFARARDLPLSLSVQGPADKAIQLLVRKYASRLRNLQTPCPRGMLLEKTTTPWFPSMKILAIDHSLHHARSYDMDLRSPCFPLLHNTPNLVECTLDGDCNLEYIRPTQPLKLSGLSPRIGMPPARFARSSLRYLPCFHDALIPPAAVVDHPVGGVHRDAGCISASHKLSPPIAASQWRRCRQMAERDIQTAGPFLSSGTPTKPASTHGPPGQQAGDRRRLRDAAHRAVRSQGALTVIEAFPWRKRPGTKPRNHSIAPRAGSGGDEYLHHPRREREEHHLILRFGTPLLSFTRRCSRRLNSSTYPSILDLRREDSNLPRASTPTRQVPCGPVKQGTHS
ncbi:hypothetical protein C8R47DRAFT_458336 [Mycena vitilis]|nr:hypothetical protein C8R47DRAFT_458336 [Mycena vitilis]